MNPQALPLHASAPETRHRFDPIHEAALTLRNLSDIEAFESRPLAHADLPRSTYEMLARSESRHATLPALSFFSSMQGFRTPVTWTYSELMQEIRRFANALHANGYRPHDVVAYVLPNLPETHFVLWGAQANGIVLAVNPLLSADAIGQLLQAAKTKVVVTLAPRPGGDLSEKVRQALQQVGTAELLVEVDLARHASGVSEDAAAEDRAPSGTAASLRNASNNQITVTSFDRFMAAQQGDRLISERVFEADSVSSYFCTGGTTGLPKIAVREHLNEVFDAYAMTCMMADGLRPGKTLFCGLPLFHANGQLVTGLAPWSVGAHVVLGTPDGYRGPGVLEGFWAMVEHYRINFFSGVPTVYSALLQQPCEGFDLRSLELGMCGAAPMPVELFRRFEERTGVRILEGYGLTEGACASSLNPLAGESRIGSIGLRFPYQQMRVLRLDAEGNYLCECETDEIGVIAISGPNVFRGYLQDEHNRGVWLALEDGQRWFNTGDMGRQDSDGYFWLTGRKKELIIRGGHNIDPQFIEEPLYRHPAVEMAAAVGRPDAHAGELPVAYVKLRAQGEVTAQQLMDYLAREIAEPAAMPKRLQLVDALPLTAIGKIFKPALVMQEIEDVVSTAAQAHEAQLLHVRVKQDPRHGYIASVTVQGRSPGFEQHLARFGFRSEVATPEGAPSGPAPVDTLEGAAPCHSSK
ncbi:acyl-CoA synthetase [Variovorax boronicumulans]|uniref:acyl-CoA synthetase n=1 Tax=Variovorax boronicumulans TaxID=436515 RepID=UPI0036F2B40E